MALNSEMTWNSETTLNSEMTQNSKLTSNSRLTPNSELSQNFIPTMVEYHEDSKKMKIVESVSSMMIKLRKVCRIPNRNMSKSIGWTLQSCLLMLWMEKTLVNNQTTIDDK